MSNEIDSNGNLARDIQSIKSMLVEVINNINTAESEVPERMRRFVDYFHNVRDIITMYEERGHSAPQYVLKEAERCDDRYRQLLEEYHSDGNAFEKIRREMADDPANRWEHTRLLPKTGE